MGIKKGVKLESFMSEILPEALSGKDLYHIYRKHFIQAGSLLTVKDVKFIEEIFIDKNLHRVNNEIRFENCHFVLESRFSGFNQLTFESCTFDEGHWLPFNNDRATYMRCHFSKASNLGCHPRLVKLYISDCHFEDRLSVSNSSIESGLLRRCKGKSIRLESLTFQDGLNVEEVKVDEMEMHEVGVNGNLHFTDCAKQRDEVNIEFDH